MTGTLDEGPDGPQFDYGQNNLEGSAAYHWPVGLWKENND